MYSSPSETPPLTGNLIVPFLFCALFIQDEIRNKGKKPDSVCVYAHTHALVWMCVCLCACACACVFPDCVCFYFIAKQIRSHASPLSNLSC